MSFLVGQPQRNFLGRKLRIFPTPVLHMQGHNEAAQGLRCRKSGLLRSHFRNFVIYRG